MSCVALFIGQPRRGAVGWLAHAQWTCLHVPALFRCVSGALGQRPMARVGGERRRRRPSTGGGRGAVAGAVNGSTDSTDDPDLRCVAVRFSGSFRQDRRQYMVVRHYGTSRFLSSLALSLQPTACFFLSGLVENCFYHIHVLIGTRNSRLLI